MNQPIQHYENFPVASWLCPPKLRAPIAAIYHFARTADDIADEGDASASQRLEDLARMRNDLQASANGQAFSEHWPAVFAPLGDMISQFSLPVTLFQDLLDAFTQDVIKTRDGSTYADQDELLDYCRRSANPVGRLLLHLYGIQDENKLRMSDQICSALQLINFWQDLSLDIPRGRHYLPVADCHIHQVSRLQLEELKQTPNATALIASQVQKAKDLMLSGQALVHHIPGRAGWELRLVVQGGLRIVEKIEQSKFSTLLIRPKLSKQDVPLLIWRSWRM